MLHQVDDLTIWDQLPNKHRGNINGMAVFERDGTQMLLTRSPHSPTAFASCWLFFGICVYCGDFHLWHLCLLVVVFIVVVFICVCCCCFHCFVLCEQRREGQIASGV